MNAWICAPWSTDHDPTLDKKSAISVTFVISCGFIVFWNFRTAKFISVIFLLTEMVLELINDLHL